MLFIVFMWYEIRLELYISYYICSLSFINLILLLFTKFKKFSWINFSCVSATHLVWKGHRLSVWNVCFQASLAWRITQPLLAWWRWIYFQTQKLLFYNLPLCQGLKLFALFSSLFGEPPVGVVRVLREASLWGWSGWWVGDLSNAQWSE